MKKVVLLFAVAIAAFSANAQTGKGTWLLGGSAGFSSGKSSGGTSTTQFNISPDAGYFVAENVAVGGMLSFSSYKYVATTTNFNVAPFVRYYFLPLGTSAKLFGEGMFGFGSQKTTGFSAVNSTMWQIKAGPAFFLNESIALETALYYNSNKVKSTPAYNTFGVNVGFQIHFNCGHMAKK
jgi:hypothetical protein